MMRFGMRATTYPQSSQRGRNETCFDPLRRWGQRCISGGCPEVSGGCPEVSSGKKWNPDLICGTSVGAINAVATASGMTLERMAHFWSTCDRQKIYKIALKKFIRSFFCGLIGYALLRIKLSIIMSKGLKHRTFSYKNEPFPP